MASLGLNLEEQKAVDRFRKDVVEPSMTKLVILDFWAEWCGPCKQLTPVLEKVAAEYADKGVVLAKVNVDEEQFIAAQFQVRSIPTVYAMFQGQPVADLTGARTESQLRQYLDQILAKVPVQAGDEPAQSQAEIRSSGLRIGDVPQTNAVSQVGSGATVNELLIENTGNQAVYLQAGDVVKGGKQDRTIGQDIVLGPKSGKVPVSAFCVESGRWSTRSGQGLGFLASSYCVNTKGLKLAVMLDADQGKVWEEVAKAQILLQHSVGEDLADAASPTSLQLTLENDKLTTRVDEYGAALEAIVARHDDAIGYAFAVNGELNSADVYASNALFKKLWPKLLKASSTEAFGRVGDEKAAPGCTVDQVAACLSKTGGKETSKDAGGVTIVSRESKDDVVFETRVGAKPLRWNYLTK